MRQLIRGSDSGSPYAARRKGTALLQLAFYAAAYFGVWGLMRIGVITDFSFAVIVTTCINIVLAASLNLIDRKSVV